MDGPVRQSLWQSRTWTQSGMDEAVRLVLADSKDFLFGSMMGEMVKLPELKEQLRDILIKGGCDLVTA